MEDLEKRQIELARNLNGVEYEFKSNELIESKSVNEENIATFVISTISLDSHRSIVNTRGLDYKTRFYDPDKKKNPINLFNHDYDKIVGNAMYVKHGSSNQTELIMAGRFSDATQTSRDIKALVKDDVLRATSIGFIPKRNLFDDEAKKAFEADFSDLKYKAPEGLEWYIPESVLCEVSYVSVGSNMDALKRSLTEFDPYVRMVLTAELLSEKVSFLEKNYKEMLDAVNDLTTGKLSLSEQLEAERNERLLERKQLVEIFKDALKARDVSPKKVETLGIYEVENLIEKIIKKKKGIVK